MGRKIKHSMYINTRALISVTLISFVFFGTGCSSGSKHISEEDLLRTTESLTLNNHSTMILNQTVFGLDGVVVNLLGGQSEDRKVSITDWLSGDRVALAWSIDTKAETQDSLSTRVLYDEKYTDAPIGTEIPKKPEQQFEQRTISGNLSSESLIDAQSILLPALWPANDTVLDSDGSLIWLSTKQYDELLNKRKTVLNLGLFDESIADAIAISDKLQNFVNSIKKDAATVKDSDELLSVTADQDFGTFTLLVNGNTETVRTIEAHNWFGRYSILANRDNPLILEVFLSPTSKGSINIFSKQNLLDAFAGYKVTEIVL